MPASPTPEPRVVDPAVARRLLLSLVAAMVAGGQPVYDVEAELRRVAWTMGHTRAQVAAAPTQVLVALAPGESSAMQVVPGMLRLDQSEVVNDIRRGLVSGRLEPADAITALSELRDLRPRFGAPGAYLGNAVIAAGISMLMQPAWPNVLLAAILSLLVTGLTRLSSRLSLLGTLLPTVAAFVVAMAVLLVWRGGLIDGPLRTIICPIAVLLPGATLATGMAELAAGMMVAGTARFVYGATQLALATLGVLTAAMVTGVPSSSLGNERLVGIGLWAAPVGLAIISLGMVLSESLPLGLAPWAFSILAATFAVQTWGTHVSSTVVGVFLGALVASLGAGLAEALRPHVPRLVVFLPSFWLLVPGTLGLIGVTQLGTHQAGVGSLLDVVAAIIAIAMGLMIGATLARPFGRLARLRRRAHDDRPDSGAPVAVSLHGE